MGGFSLLEWEEEEYLDEGILISSVRGFSLLEWGYSHLGDEGILISSVGGFSLLVWAPVKLSFRERETALDSLFTDNTRHTTSFPLGNEPGSGEFSLVQWGQSRIFTDYLWDRLQIHQPNPTDILISLVGGFSLLEWRGIGVPLGS